ncbi:hypothetical protein F4778DRAFT_784117 [Xylariomycetidae sp. FL2044]|nr:hypothetical protein F4778DRAFT_784117 [Xylariomycetidae sp. FL2044]
MQFTIILTLLLARLITAAPAPAPAAPASTIPTPEISSEENTSPFPYELIAGTEPDCVKMKDYCTHCKKDDFACDTNANCEWCRKHKKF